VIHLKVKLTVCGNDIFYNLRGFYMILKAKIVLGNWPDLEGGNWTQDKARALSLEGHVWNWMQDKA